MTRRGISRLLSDYGMALVLLLLCIYYSWATLRTRQLSGAEAADDVAKKVTSTKAKPNVVVVAGISQEDQLFAELIAKKLPVERVANDPSSARSMIQELVAAGRTPDFFIATEDTAKWLPNVLERIPAAKNTPILSPGTYTWPDFLQKDNLLNIANQIVVIAVIAVGMTMVIITGGIDLSVGSLVALSAVITGLLIRDHAGGAAAGTPALIACSIAGILAAGLVGGFSGAMITFFRVPPFIATLAMMRVASGLAYKFAAGQSIYDIPQSFTTLSRNGILVLVIVYIIAHIVMSRTKLGRYIYAVGGNSEAARLSGVRVGAMFMTVYIVSGMAAGLGGVIMASQLKSSAPTYGQAYELFVISAVVVGGTSLSGGEGRIFGTLIGALIIAVIQNGMNLTGVEDYSQRVVSGLVILGAVMLDTLKKRPWKLPRWLRRVDSSQSIKESDAPIS
jgi:ribose transport system permease protein